MTRDEFTSLPPMIALGLIYDMAEKRLAGMPRPNVPKPPLYDGKIGKGRDGFVWMSEMTLRDLEWWRNTNQKSAASGGQYAEKNGKTAATLSKWIEWRALFPSECWSGKRGDDRVTAAFPSRDPHVHQWGPKNEKKPAASSGRRDGAPPPEDGGDDYGF